jgi:hypothetical protein
VHKTGQGLWPRDSVLQSVALSALAGSGLRLRLIKNASLRSGLSLTLTSDVQTATRLWPCGRYCARSYAVLFLLPAADRAKPGFGKGVGDQLGVFL